MANYWAITIGINQYQHLQPLMHAQNDALFVHRFLTETAGIPTDSCVLLSDLATSVGQQAVYPDKPALSEWIQTMTQRVQPDDVLWFFFSGYGVQVDGLDYLMPIDGDPGQTEATGLAATKLVETLAQLPTACSLLVLDINRSQGSFSGQTIGQQLIDLAEAHQVSLLLSCQPEQYSHETFGVRHGLFTAALLEAFQQKCTTPGQIADYITKRLPELCEHHWRPIQNPVSSIPTAQRSVVVIPEAVVIPETQQATDLAQSAGAATHSDADLGIPALPAKTPALAGSAGTLVGTPEVSQASSPAATTSGSVSLGRASASSIGSESELGVSDASSNGSNGSSGPSRTGGLSTSPDSDYRNSSAIVPASKTSIAPSERKPLGAAVDGARLRNWGLAALAVLMLGVLLKQPFVRSAWQSLTGEVEATSDGTAGEAPAGQVAVPAVPEEEAAVLEEDMPEGSASEGNAPEESTPESATTVPDSAVSSAPDSTASSAASSAASSSAVSEAPAPEVPAVESKAPDASTQALLAQASAALAQRQYSEALINLQRVPKGQRDSAFSSILTKARAGVAEAQQYNASVLTDARTSIQPTQASQFADAIATARLIEPGQPYYDEAQRDIRSWSQIILDIAEGRATGGNLNGAIAAARVMPADNPEFRQKAQERIVFWQQRQKSREIIAAAQEIPRSGQASTYQKGIVRLQEVPIEHPEYETSQRLADEWSDRIFSIAQARAAQGRWDAAIQAAVLVPAGTTAYEPTQAAIKRWQAEQ